MTGYGVYTYSNGDRYEGNLHPCLCLYVHIN
jgi:hypothetical protein